MRAAVALHGPWLRAGITVLRSMAEPARRSPTPATALHAYAGRGQRRSILAVFIVVMAVTTFFLTAPYWAAAVQQQPAPAAAAGSARSLLPSMAL